MEEKRKSCLRHRSNSVRVIQVVEVVTTVGNGAEDNPYSSVREYWSLDGSLLAVTESEEIAAELPEETHLY